MPLSKRTEEEFEKRNFQYYDTYNNDFKSLNDDPLSDELKEFIHQAQVDAIKEFVDGIVPEKDNNFKKIKFDGDYEKIVNKQISDAIKIGYNLAIDEIQERINNKLKEI